MLEGIRPQAFVKLTDNDGKDKIINADKISSIGMVSKALVIKDGNDKVLGRIENSDKKPQDVAEQLGLVLDLVG